MSIPNQSVITVQKLLSAFGAAVEEVEPTWPEAIEAAIGVLIICMRAALNERDAKDTAATDALLEAFATQLRELVGLALAQHGGDVS